MEKTLGNNGNQLAEMMLNDGRLQPNKSVEEHEIIAIEHYATTPQQRRWLTNDSFWEDFIYRCGELGVEVKC